MKNFSILIALWFCFIGTISFSQNVGISPSSSAPDASAGLDVNFTDKGLLIPRVSLASTTTASPVTDPATSLLVYNTATTGDVTPGYYFWNGTAWTRLSSSLDGSGTANFFPKWTSENTLGSSQVYDDGTNVGIGTATPGAKLEVAGTLKVTDGTQGANKVLTSDENGLASWQESELTDLAGSTNPEDCLQLKSTVNTGQSPKSIIVEGNYAYVINYVSNSLITYDVSNPDEPAEAGSVNTGLNPSSVALSGNYAYVANYSDKTLTIYDVSDPANPSLQGFVTLLFRPVSIHIGNNYAYVFESGGLDVIDISNATSPVSMHLTNMDNTDVSLNNYLYVLDGNSQLLKIYNLTNPVDPVLAGLVNTGLQASSMTVSGNYAYVLYQELDKMTIFDVSDPEAPFVSGTVTTGTDPASVAVSNGFAFVVNQGSNTLSMIDVSDPLNPVIAEEVGTDLSPVRIVISGDYAYVANSGSNTLQVIQIACPQNILLQDGCLVVVPATWSDSAENIFNANTGNVGIGTAIPEAKLDIAGTIRIADGTQGINKILTSDSLGFARWQSSAFSDLLSQQPPGCFEMQSRTNTAVNPAGIVLSDNLAYIITGDNSPDSLFIFDIADPENPLQLGAARCGDNPWDLAVSGNFAYVVSNSGNNIIRYNVSNPENPVPTDTVSMYGDPSSVAVSGNYAFVLTVGNSKIWIFDISHPDTMAQVSINVCGSAPRSIAISGNYAYVVHLSGILSIWDVSHPGYYISQVGMISTQNFPKSVAVQGHYAFVTSYNSDMLSIFNILNPYSPILAGEIQTGDGPQEVVVSGNYAYVVNRSSNTMSLFDISNPALPALVNTLLTDDWPTGLAASKDNVLVVNMQSNTMQAFRVKCPQINVELEDGEVVLNNPTWIMENNDLYSNQGGDVGIGTTTPGELLDVAGGNIRTDQQFISTQASGTAPLSVTSNTLVSNLNADLLDGQHASGFAASTGSAGYIQNQTAADQAAGFRINGNGIFNGGKIGIGTSSPTGNLHIEKTGDVTVVLNADTDNAGGEEDNPRIELRQDGGGVVGAIGLTGSNNALHDGDIQNAFYIVEEYSEGALQFGTNNEIKMTILPTGYIGIGTNSPVEKLDVDGSVRAKFNVVLESNNTTPTIAGMRHDGNNLLYVYNDNACNNGVYLAEGGTSWQAFSDIRLKKDFEPVKNILDDFCKLSVTRFHMKTDPDTMAKRLGFIAQEVQPLFPYVVSSDGEYLGLSYTDFGVLSVEAIKELRAEKDAEIAALKNENRELEKRLESLQARIEQIQQYLEMSSQK